MPSLCFLDLPWQGWGELPGPIQGSERLPHPWKCPWEHPRALSSQRGLPAPWPTPPLFEDCWEGEDP